MRKIKEKINQKWDWRMGVVMGLIILLGGSYLMGMINRSQVWGHNYRDNLVMVGEEGGVSFVSFDSEERQILVINWPSKLLIKSRSVGSYRIGDLYQLGAYENQAGELARRKVQGFMKIPLLGYVVGNGETSRLVPMFLRAIWQGTKVTSISRFDAVTLLLRLLSYRIKEVGVDELLRAGVIEEEGEGYLYQAGRLQQFLGVRVFDWGVGEERLLVAIVNDSGMTGLATDVASFFENVGADVVMVRSGESEREVTEVLLSRMSDKRQDKIKNMLTSWFEWSEYQESEVEEYRAEMVIKLGRDAAKLF